MSLTGLAEDETVFPFSPLPILHIPVPGISPHVNALRRMITLERLRRASQHFAQVIDSQQFDVALVNDCIISLKPFLVRYLHTPYVFYTHHGAYGGRYATVERLDQNRPRNAIDRAKQLYYWPTQRLTTMYERHHDIQNARAANYVVANSLFAAESYFQHYGLPAHVVYYGVDSNSFFPICQARSDYILSVGGLAYHKGYRFLIQVLSRVPAAHRPKLLIIANSVDPQEYAFLQQQAALENVKLEVKQIWNDRELAEIYSQALLFAYAPILEPFGFAPLESMACGTPVVAVKEGGPRESVLDGETGFLVERDPILFAEALRRLLDKPELRDQMGRKGVEYVRSQWTWQRAVEELEHRMHEVIGYVE
jgi:glycosyltransferase involved in cell wall biosynthesis